MIKIKYSIFGNAISDFVLDKVVDYWLSNYQFGEDKYYNVSTANVFDRVRLLALTQYPDLLEEIVFIYDGQEIKLDKYSNPDVWIKGFCDQHLSDLKSIFKEQIAIKQKEKEDYLNSRKYQLLTEIRHGLPDRRFMHLSNNLAIKNELTGELIFLKERYNWGQLGYVAPREDEFELTIKNRGVYEDLEKLIKFCYTRNILVTREVLSTVGKEAYDEYCKLGVEV